MDRSLNNLLYLILAFKNCVKNKRRTLLTSCGISFGVCAILLFGGFMGNLFDQLRELTIHSGLGHIQIVKTGYRERGSLDPQGYSIDNPKIGRAHV